MSHTATAPASCSHAPLELAMPYSPIRTTRTPPPHRWYVEEGWEYICSSGDEFTTRWIACLCCRSIVYVDRQDWRTGAWFAMKADVIPDLMDSVEDTNEVLSHVDAWYDGTLADPEGSLMRPEQLTNELPSWVDAADCAWLLGES